MYTPLRLAFLFAQNLFLNGITKRKRKKYFYKTGDPVSLRVFLPVNLKPNPLKKHCRLFMYFNGKYRADSTKVQKQF